MHNAATLQRTTPECDEVAAQITSSNALFFKLHPHLFVLIFAGW